MIMARATGAPDRHSLFFDDVEWSTQLLHEFGAEAYAETLAVYRQVIRRACALHGGVDVDIQGDAFFVAFATAPAALAAAAELTEALTFSARFSCGPVCSWDASPVR